MLCIRPFRPRPGQEFGCGQCLPCRINKRRMWTARILLEGLFHEASAFFTLTYEGEFLPPGGSLDPGHLEEFRYKLRHAIGPFRYYFIGEYGERGWRPHYHGILFGKLPSALEIWEIWRRGRVHVGFLEHDSAGYIAGYVTKKLTKRDDDRLGGRHPEFSRMSRKPGIGVTGLSIIADWINSSDGAKYVAHYGDVPHTVRLGGKIFPLGRYLVSRLRETIDLPSQNWTKYVHSEAVRLEMAVPEVMAQREISRVHSERKAQAYQRLRGAKESI